MTAGASGRFARRAIAAASGGAVVVASAFLYLDSRQTGRNSDASGPGRTGTAPATSSPVVATGTTAGDVALSFSRAWVKHTGVTPKSWLDGMRPYSTVTLASELTGVDPAGVPSSKVTGSPKVVTRSSGVASVETTADHGRITLRVLQASGRWLVDGNDWDPR